MSLSSDEAPGPADALNEALVSFTGLIGTALEGICSYGLTIGEAYVPFDLDDDEDCEDEDGVYCSQAWVRVNSVLPSDDERTTNMDGDHCAVMFRIELEVGVLRCFEAKDNGEAPTTTEVLAAAMQAMEDMTIIHSTAMNSDLWPAIEDGQWLPLGPMGGQYGGSWGFTVEFPSPLNCE